MKLAGSCHCKRVQFALESAHPYPYNRCYCSVCRKTAGAGGYAINLGGEFVSLQITGKEHIRIYQAMIENPATGKSEQSPARRHFCGTCGSALWVWAPRWPELVHPFASAIDSNLPIAPEHTHLMLDFKAGWVPVHGGTQDKFFQHYPDESLAAWHQRLNLEK